MQFKDIVFLLAAAGSAVTALPAPEAENAPVRRAEQAEQGEQGKQGKQWLNPDLDNLSPGGLPFGQLNFLQNNQQQDPRCFQLPQFCQNGFFQDPRLFSLGGNNGFFKRDLDGVEENHLAARAEQAKQGKQIFPGLDGNNQFFPQQNGFGQPGGGGGIIAGGFGTGGVSLNGLGNNNNNLPPWLQNNQQIPPWLLNQRLNRGNGFPNFLQNFGGPQGNNNPFDFFN